MGFLNIFGSKQVKESKTVVLNSKMGPAHWTPDNYENFIAETYLKNRICFRCIFMIAQAISTVEWKLFKWKDDKIEKVENHEVLKLLKRANPHESFNFLLFKWIIYLLSSGNSFIERIKIGSEEIPRELYTLRPDKIIIMTNPNTGRLDKYVYDQTISYDIDPITGDSDLLHVKLPDPLNDFWGAAPVKALMREIDTSNEAIEWQKKILENEGRPGLVFTVDGTLSDKQYDRLEKLLKEKYQGSSNAGNNLIVEGGAKAIPYNWTPAELDFMESNRELARGISSGWGVPPQLIGILGDSTYSNFETARQVFWEDTILPYLKMIKDELNNWFFGIDNPNDLFLDFDLEKIPALFMKRQKIWKMAQESDFLLINEKRRLLGLNDIEGGNVILIPLNYTILQPGSPSLIPVLSKTQIADVEDDGKLNNSTSDDNDDSS